MALEWTDILIIIAIVIGALLILLCLINICYNLCRKKDDDDGNSSTHHQEYRSGGYEYSLTPSGHFESAVHITHEKPTAYTKAVSKGYGYD